MSALILRMPVGVSILNYQFPGAVKTPCAINPETPPTIRLYAECHLVDPEDNTDEQQQRAKPADSHVCAEHSEPVQEQNEISNTRQHEPDFGRRSEGHEDGYRCDASFFSFAGC